MYSHSQQILVKRSSYAIGVVGLSILFFIALQWLLPSVLWLSLCFLFLTASVALYTFQLYYNKPNGIKNNFIESQSLTNRGAIGILLGFVLTGFYYCLYWYPELLGKGTTMNSGLIALFDPLSFALKKQQASEWFVYGVLYTFAILIFGIKFIIKYWGNRYQMYRTISVIFFQIIFAFLLPEFMLRMNLPYNDLKNMWPLNYYFFDSWNVGNLFNAGFLGKLMFYWGIAMIFIVSPVLTYLYGKRWYCSWVSRTGLEYLAGISTATLRSWYGFVIGAVFSGVIGVGFYPILGSRVWCRFGCPMAAILGIQQRFFSRFRITTNSGQCISCGNCSKYCEMGIDVRSYAQRGENIVRASCVGCGICASVCPRGVLKLENDGTNVLDRLNKTKTSFIKESEIQRIR